VSRRFDPWVGFGFGYEWLRFSATPRMPAAFGSFIVRAGGFELANLQIGGDLRLARRIEVGPFASCSVGSYRSFEATQEVVPSRAFHGWFVIGARGVYDVGL
jgi:hypothetical protein